MAGASFHVGQLVRAYAYFRNRARVLTDPTAVVAKYEDPSGNETTKTYGTDPEVVKESAGVYYIDISVDEAGTWYCRFNGTGTLQTATEQSFTAAATQF